MVSRKFIIGLSLLVVVLCISLSVAVPPFVKAQGVAYTVAQEWVEIWINADRSINLQYNLTITYLSGQPQGIVTVGMPKSGFQIQFVQDNSGSSLSYQDTSQGSFYGIDVSLKGPIIINQPYTFIVYATVPSMVQQDTTNQGNVGMSFYPTTFSDALGSITDLRVAIVLPQGVTSNETKYPTGVPFNNVFVQGNNLVVFWEEQNWPPGQTFKPGVSFPEQFVNPAPQGGLSDTDFAIIGGAIFFVVVIIIVAVFAGIAKSAYSKPQISVEALGANRTHRRGGRRCARPKTCSFPYDDPVWSPPETNGNRNRNRTPNQTQENGKTTRRHCSITKVLRDRLPEGHTDRRHTRGQSPGPNLQGTGGYGESEAAGLLKRRHSELLQVHR